jgi:hypothetical protein
MQDLLKIRQRLDEALRGKRVQLYFAFGTLLSKERICDITLNKKVIRISPASLHNYKLIFRGVADIIHQESAYVNGAIYAITENDERRLDMYESYPSLYGKVHLDFNGFTFNQELISNLNLASQKIMFYQMQNRSEIYPPSENTIKTIEAGYREWKLDLSTLKQAIAESEQHQTHLHQDEFDTPNFVPSDIEPDQHPLQKLRSV